MISVRNRSLPKRSVDTMATEMLAGIKRNDHPAKR
jgi:hypothetical protein